MRHYSDGLLVRTSLAAAQAPSLDRIVDRFVLDVAAVNAADLSADGKCLAATVGSLRDRIGIDNSRFQDPTSRKTWERGLERYDVQAKRLTTLIRDGQIYSNFRLSKDGTTFVFMAADGNRPADLFSANADFTSVRRLTTANPSLFTAGGGSKTELVSYLDADGKKLYGELYYTDSPRLGVRNTHAPEKSQDRIGGTLWEQPQKYIQHSSVMFADRIKTPLLLFT